MHYKPEYKVYVITGEESGENIAYEILKKLTNKINIKFYGIGGDKLKRLGLEPIFSVNELSIMGILEIIPKIPKLINLIYKTYNDILNVEPHLIISVDSPGFVFRVLQKVKIKKNISTLHIVAPTVWAWKPNRAKKISKYVDNLFVLFPFEKKYFVPHGIKTTYIGHPFLNNIKNINSTKDLLQIKKKIISIFPGSRKGEIDIHLNTILLFLSKNKLFKHYKFIIIAVDRHYDFIKNIAKLYKGLLDISVLNSSKYKNYAFKYSDYAIAVSGTITLELAISKVPLIVVYKLNFLSFFILKKLVKVKYVSLANIILNKNVIPELIQYNFSYVKFNKELENLIFNQRYKNRQLKMFNKLEYILQKNIKNYGAAIAVNAIIKLLKEN